MNLKDSTDTLNWLLGDHLGSTSPPALPVSSPFKKGRRLCSEAATERNCPSLYQGEGKENAQHSQGCGKKGGIDPH
jgi:hypothetical protein